MAVKLSRHYAPPTVTPARRRLRLVRTPGGVPPDRPGWFERQMGAAVSEPSVQPEELFAAVDGQELFVAGRHWLIEVYGVLDREGSRWIQVGLKGQRDLMTTLKLAPSAGVRHAMLGLASWLANPPALTDSLDVA